MNGQAFLSCFTISLRNITINLELACGICQFPTRFLSATHTLMSKSNFQHTKQTHANLKYSPGFLRLIQFISNIQILFRYPHTSSFESLHNSGEYSQLIGNLQLIWNLKSKMNLIVAAASVCFENRKQIYSVKKYVYNRHRQQQFYSVMIEYWQRNIRQHTCS